MTHISLELAKWLKERGCEIEADYEWWHYPDYAPHWRLQNVKWMMDNGFVADTHDQEIQAYSWYDILVTYAKEFWGEGEVCGDCGRMLKPDVFHRKNDTVDGFSCDCGFQVQPFFMGCYEHHTSELLQRLQQNKIQEAEDYVRQYSVFANPKP